MSIPSLTYCLVEFKRNPPCTYKKWWCTPRIESTAQQRFWSFLRYWEIITCGWIPKFVGIISLFAPDCKWLDTLGTATSAFLWRTTSVADKYACVLGGYYKIHERLVDQFILAIKRFLHLENSILMIVFTWWFTIKFRSVLKGFSLLYFYLVKPWGIWFYMLPQAHKCYWIGIQIQTKPMSLECAFHGGLGSHISQLLESPLGCVYHWWLHNMLKLDNIAHCWRLLLRNYSHVSASTFDLDAKFWGNKNPRTLHIGQYWTIVEGKFEAMGNRPVKLDYQSMHLINFWIKIKKKIGAEDGVLHFKAVHNKVVPFEKLGRWKFQIYKRWSGWPIFINCNRWLVRMGRRSGFIFSEGVKINWGSVWALDMQVWGYLCCQRQKG